MSQGNQSSLRFSLEESVWFRKGQEVAELVSVSLDPDITIQESDQYVTISGTLQLTGEYKRHEESVADEEDYTTTLKYVQVVEEREEGVCDFIHGFPVDITIPNNRIQSIYDVDVNVESFDYVIPERSCLKLVAELTISGLYGDQQHEPAEEVEELETVFRSFETVEKVELEENDPSLENAEDIYMPFSAEARKKSEEQFKPETVSVPVFDFQPLEDAQLSWETQPDLGEFSGQLRAETKQPQLEREEEAPQLQNKTDNEEVQEEVTLPQGGAIVEQPSLKNGMNHTGEAQSSKNGMPVEVSSSEESPSPPQETKKKKSSKKKGMSLTEFFSRKVEDETPAKLKVCIVQKGESLETLSDRYEISVQNLLRINQLEINQEVYEGQVLYIPVVLARNN